jgi:hypothetical protein
MKKPAFLILLCFGIQAQAPHRFGAIDSVSIPDNVLNTPRETIRPLPLTVMATELAQLPGQPGFCGYPLKSSLTSEAHAWPS